MSNNLDRVNVIGFDADDTLWINEPLFRAAENEFCQLLSRYDIESKIIKELYHTELSNISRFGYGIKGFALSMMETALRITDGDLDGNMTSRILDIAYQMMDAPVEVLPEVSKTLQSLKETHRLIMVTKGDLFDQEKKLVKSGLESYFHHIEIVSEKHPSNYQKLLSHLDITPQEFLMVGNSLKSDVLPVIKIGAQAIHLPFHTTWVHEQVTDQELKDHEYLTIDHISALIGLLEA